MLDSVMGNLLASGVFYDMPLWGKVVGPVLLVLFGAGLVVAFFFARKKMLPTKPGVKLAWYHWAWIHGVLVLGIIAIIVAVGYIIAAVEPGFLGQY